MAPDPDFSLEDIDRIGRGLLEASLPRSQWTHAAHFAAAVWLLARSGLDAMREMPALIRAYNVASGVANTDTGGYHETITLASLRAAASWLDSHPGRPLEESLKRLLQSAYGRSDWLLVHWSRARLFSVQARRTWVEPDLKPLPF